MGGTEKVLCKYYLHGACKFGSACAFSHNLADSTQSQVCSFWLKGHCAYGDSCRYLHTRPDWAKSRRDAGGASSSQVAPLVRRPAADDLAEQLPISSLRLGGQAPDAGAEAGGGSPLPLPVSLPQDPFDGAGADSGTSDGEEADAARQAQYVEARGDWTAHGEQGWPAGGEAGWPAEGEEGWQAEGDYWQHEGQEGGWSGEGDGEYWQPGYDEGEEDGWDAAQQQRAGLQPPAGDTSAAAARAAAWSLPADADDGQHWAGASHPSLRSLCMQWFSSGACSKGDRCQLVHGELCQHCHKHALHPSDAAARQQHATECAMRHERLAARARSAAVECGICLEPVLAKAMPGDRKFGLLTGCDHPFCLRCIRSWRQNMDGSVDIDTALRTCPVCRVTSHFIVPSLVWPTTAEEKERILAGYKAKLAQIDCRYFNFGDSTCPFGTSCFYRHAFHDGRLQDREGPLRKAADEEGNVQILQPVRLSDFIAISSAGQRLGRRR